MQYSFSQLSKIKSKIFAKVAYELERAQDSDEVDALLEKYEIVFEEECIPVNTRTMRILVFGALVGNVNDYRKAARNLGIDPDYIVFENDYEKLTNYDSERLRNSFEYSDIIMGSNPHSIKNNDGYSSLTARIKANKSEFPRLIESPDCHSLKLSISGFKTCIKKTRYYENIIS